MLANVGGSLALGLGLVVLLLPLLTPELSRPRDAAWGALVLLLGLALVTSSDRLTGSPMVVVVCAGLLIGRLATEVGQARWRQLSPEEQRRLGSLERWSTALAQLGQTGLGLAGQTAAFAGGLGGWLVQHRPGARRSTTKRWVRPALESAAVPLAVAVAAAGTAAEPVAAEALATEPLAAEAVAAEAVAAEKVSAEAVAAEPVAAAVAPIAPAVVNPALTVKAAAGAEVVEVSSGPGGSRDDGAG
jgi:hypothetical protein